MKYKVKKLILSRLTFLFLLLATAFSLVGFGNNVEAVEAIPDASLNAKVEYLIKKRSINREEAEKRLRWDDGAANLFSSLQKEYPDTLGGVWIGANDDRVKVGTLAGKENGKALEDAVVQSGLQEGVDYIPVKYSYDDLVRLSYDLSKESQALKNNGFYMQFGVIPSKNKVEVSIPSENAHLSGEQLEFINRIKSTYKDNLNLETTIPSVASGSQAESLCSAGRSPAYSSGSWFGDEDAV